MKKLSTLALSAALLAGVSGFGTDVMAGRVSEPSMDSKSYGTFVRGINSDKAAEYKKSAMVEACGWGSC